MKFPPEFERHWRGLRPSSGFSLIEVLSVMAIIVTLSAVSMPAIQSLKGAGSVNKAVADFSRTLELARTYAMANRTYVRVLLAQQPAQNGRMMPATVVLPVFSADGTTASSDMTDSAIWPALSKPMALDDLLIFDPIQGAAQNDTSNDSTPLGGNVQGPFMAAFSRNVPSWGNLEFKGVIQFSPTGEARVCFDEPTRYIKIAFDQPVPGGTTTHRKKNPFVLRLSGVNGSIKVLRAEDLAL